MHSWGTRNYKWSWWGSRTSDGCHPAYVLLADHDAKFREVAWRNLELMAACTHEGLLRMVGRIMLRHGDRPCIHHAFTHAKALATVLDRGGALQDRPNAGRCLGMRRMGWKSFPEIGTRLAAVGDWRATVTENDCEYVELVLAGGGQGGGHATGGALTMRYHRTLGPVLTASMTEYKLIEDFDLSRWCRSGPDDTADAAD